MVQRALIVEDEPLIAIDLEATVRTLGFEVCGPPQIQGQPSSSQQAVSPILS
jgi:hypothetical protein